MKPRRRVLRDAGLLVCLSLGACSLTTDLDGFEAPAGATADAGADRAAIDDGRAPTLNDPDALGAADAGDGEAAADPAVLFRDDFDRDDGPVGNGWLDPKGRYFISGKQVPVGGSGEFAFQATYLYRPKLDEARDIEVSIDFKPLTLPASFPQVHLRAAPETASCYGVGVPLGDTIFFGRCAPGGDFVSLGDQPLKEALVVGKTYRLSISATGTDPVRLVMRLERRSDSGELVVIGEKATDDNAPERVKSAGMFGVSANGQPNWVYDNFLATRVRD